MTEKVWTKMAELEARLAKLETKAASRPPALNAFAPEIAAEVELMTREAIESIAQAKPKKPATKKTKKAGSE